MTNKTIEQLAEAAHQIWMEGKLRDGWAYGPHTDKVAKLHACLIAYTHLSEADKQSDRDLVLGIPEIFARAGYMVVWRRLPEPPPQRVSLGARIISSLREFSNWLTEKRNP